MFFKNPLTGPHPAMFHAKTFAITCAIREETFYSGSAVAKAATNPFTIVSAVVE